MVAEHNRWRALAMIRASGVLVMALVAFGWAPQAAVAGEPEPSVCKDYTMNFCLTHEDCELAADQPCGDDIPYYGEYCRDKGYTACWSSPSPSCLEGQGAIMVCLFEDGGGAN